MDPLNVAVCIGCGCDDNHACRPFGCAWVCLDRAAKVGVCNRCGSEIERWSQGDRELSRRAALKIHERRAMRCRRCNEWIVWLTTSIGRRIPVDARKVRIQETRFDSERHTSHFSNCRSGGPRRPA